MHASLWLSNVGTETTQEIMNELLTPKDFLIMGFFGIWGLVGLGIILTVLYFWMKQRPADSRPRLGPRRHRAPVVSPNSRSGYARKD